MPAASAPEDWQALDRAIVQHLLPHGRAGVVFDGEAACACGGRRRYTLGGAPEQPIWRCLHCGSLFSGEKPLRWD